MECLGPDLEAASAALQAARPPAPPRPAVQHNIAAIRDLLLKAFTADALRRLVLYTANPALQPLTHEFSSVDGPSAKVEETITHCQKQDCIPDLLAEVKVANPRRYAHYEGSTIGGD